MSNSNSSPQEEDAAWRSEDAATAPLGASADRGETVVKTYNTWGPTKLSTNPHKIPLWPIMVGLVCFIGFQGIFGALYLILAIVQGAGWTENLFNFDANSGRVSTSMTDVQYPFGFIFGSLLLGWIGLLTGVWLAGRRTIGGWKNVVLWKVDWKKDLTIALAFTVLFRLLETGVGKLLEVVWHVDVSKLGNTGLLSDFTGWKQTLILFGAAVCAPIVEELFFRGTFLRGWSEKLKPSWRKSENSSNITTYAAVGSFLIFALTFFYCFSAKFPTPVSVAILAVAAGFLTWNFFKGRQDWKYSGAVISVMLSSFTFGILHAQTTPAATAYTVASTTIIGALLGVMYLRTRRLGTTVLTHIVLNSSAVLVLILFGIS